MRMGYYYSVYSNQFRSVANYHLHLQVPLRDSLAA